MTSTALIWDWTVNERLFIDGEVNKDPYLIDFVYLGMSVWHMPVYTALTVSGSAALYATTSPFLESIFLLFANISMLGVLGIFELIFVGLIAAAQYDEIWEVDSVKSQILAYSASTALTAYLQLETINGVRRWYYQKDYSQDDIKNSFCDENDADCGDDEDTEPADDDEPAARMML